MTCYTQIVQFLIMGKLILHEFKIGHDSYDRLGIF